MKRLLFAVVLTAGCGVSGGAQPVNQGDVECTFQFSAEPVCSYKSGNHLVKVSLVTKKLADDELVLTQAKVTSQGKQQVLSMSPDVSMMAGDIGIASFVDINFDNVPDIAISTSFGMANQYFDYWTYDPKTKQHVSVGNYPKLNPNPVDKTLTATIKLDAATYQQQKYSWDGGKLIRRK